MHSSTVFLTLGLSTFLQQTGIPFLTERHGFHDQIGTTIPRPITYLLSV
jgi:hypothetical protein